MFTFLTLFGSDIVFGHYLIRIRHKLSYLFVVSLLYTSYLNNTIMRSIVLFHA